MQKYTSRPGTHICSRRGRSATSDFTVLTSVSENGSKTALRKATHDAGAFRSRRNRARRRFTRRTNAHAPREQLVTCAWSWSSSWGENATHESTSIILVNDCKPRPLCDNSGCDAFPVSTSQIEMGSFLQKVFPD